MSSANLTTNCTLKKSFRILWMTPELLMKNNDGERNNEENNKLWPQMKKSGSNQQAKERQSNNGIRAEDIKTCTEPKEMTKMIQWCFKQASGILVIGRRKRVKSLPQYRNKEDVGNYCPICASTSCRNKLFQPFCTTDFIPSMIKFNPRSRRVPALWPSDRSLGHLQNHSSGESKSDVCWPWFRLVFSFCLTPASDMHDALNAAKRRRCWGAVRKHGLKKKNSIEGFLHPRSAARVLLVCRHSSLVSTGRSTVNQTNSNKKRRDLIFFNVNSLPTPFRCVPPWGTCRWKPILPSCMLVNSSTGEVIFGENFLSLLYASLLTWMDGFFNWFSWFVV